MNSEQESLILNGSQAMDKGMLVLKLKFYSLRGWTQVKSHCESIFFFLIGNSKQKHWSKGSHIKNNDLLRREDE